MKIVVIKITEEQSSWLWFVMGYALGTMYKEGNSEWSVKTQELFNTIQEHITYGTD